MFVPYLHGYILSFIFLEQRHEHKRLDSRALRQTDATAFLAGAMAASVQKVLGW